MSSQAPRHGSRLLPSFFPIIHSSPTDHFSLPPLLLSFCCFLSSASPPPGASSFSHESACCRQSDRKAAQSCVLMAAPVSAAPPAKVTLLHLQPHHQLYFWRGRFHKGLLPRCSPPTFLGKRAPGPDAPSFPRFPPTLLGARE